MTTGAFERQSVTRGGPRGTFSICPDLVKLAAVPPLPIFTMQNQPDLAAGTPAAPTRMTLGRRPRVGFACVAALVAAAPAFTQTARRVAPPAHRAAVAPASAPALLVRAAGTALPTSYAELGAGAVQRVAFERHAATGAIGLEGGALLPLNLYSDPSTRVRFVLCFDRPLAVDPANLAPERVQILWRDGGGGEHRLLSDLDLRSNSAASGVELVVSPRGILPRDADVEVRVEVGALRSNAGLAGTPGTFTTLRARTVRPTGPIADQLLETFDGLAWLDGTALHDGEAAVVQNGSVSGSGSFPGGGGPGGDFDWIVRTGETIVFDTAFQQVTGGPGGVPSVMQDVIGGRLHVRNLTLELGATLALVGPNPLRVFATGAVRIDGLIDAAGSDSLGVATLNTTNLPEPGAAGRAGGGDGGTGSPRTNASSPRGGAGFGPFQTAGRGGEGGETSYAPQSTDLRRGAGGGGGRFARDVRYRWNGLSTLCQTLIGFDAEPGFPGGFGGLGAESQSARAAGGALGPLAFHDSDPANDFVGGMSTTAGFVLGELNGLWAGSGGGAGGDASATATFPLSPFNPGGDEKGAGGGGGGGAVAIVALGPITIGASGRIVADGGHGGGGENTVFFDRVGGGSGGGSGGMILLESAVAVQIDAIAAQGPGFNQALPFYTDDPAQLRHPQRPISALGGQGGAGKDDRCGASSLGQRDWKVDAIPWAAFEGRTDVPPLGETPTNNSFLSCSTGSPNDPIGTTPGAGGDGGPGLIQVHVPHSLANLQLPPSAGGDPTFSFAPPPVGWEDGAFVGRLEPRFASLSGVTSQWIALGGAGYDPSTGAVEPIHLGWPGLDRAGYVTANGVVATTPGLPGERLRVSFDVARANAAGGVDEATSLTATRGAMTNDPDVLRSSPFEFVRFRLDFERPTGAPVPALTAHTLRLPFRF